jgi:glycerol-3-phosphate cytidylyltransferase-like family protein
MALDGSLDRRERDSEGRVKVATVGTWDFCHEGHRNLFLRCLSLTRAGGWSTDPEVHDSFFIGVNTDDFVEKYKGVRPHQHQMTRFNNVSAYGEPFYHDDDMVRDLLLLRPQLLVVGSDWAQRDYLAQIKVTQEFLDEMDISIVYVPRTPNVSSTEIRASL